MFMSVVLPQPEGPTSTVKRPRSARNEQPSTSAIRRPCRSTMVALASSTAISPEPAPRPCTGMAAAFMSALRDPRGEQPRQPADERARGEARNADGDHAADHLRRGVDLERLPQQVAEPGRARED